MTNSGNTYGPDTYWQVGTGWYGSNYTSGQPSYPFGDYSHAFGINNTSATVGGSGEYAFIQSSNWVTVSNYSSTNETLVVTALTAGLNQVQTGSWNDYAYTQTYAWFYDSLGAIYQYTETGAFALGLGGGGDAEYEYNYDLVNGLTGSAAYLGMKFPASLGTQTQDQMSYYITLAPGASDTFYTGAALREETYSIVPGPAAIAPFAIGLIGALRRRKGP